MKKIILSSCFMMITFLIFGQTKGFVFDLENKPMNKVDVFFSDQNILLITNEDGSFIIKDNIPENSLLHFYKYGYETQVIKYKNNIPLELKLEKLHVALDEVGVSESFSELGNSRVTNIEKKSLKDGFLNSTSMLHSITELSGVDMVSSGLGIQKVVVRGLSGMRVVSYLNGMQINNQQWANDHGIGFTDLGLAEVELIKGSSALKYGSEAIGGLLYFKDEPFVSSKKIKGFVATKFNNSNYLSSSQFGVKWNKENLYFNLYGQYSIATDYRLPNNKYLFNSRFKQNAIKFSISYRYNNLQNIFRYQLHNETVGIPAHVHGDPETTDIYDLSSDYLDFNDDFKATRPNQFVRNQLFVYEANYFINDFKFKFYAGHFINNLQEWEKWTRPAFNLTLSNTQMTPSVRYSLDHLTFHVGSQISILNNMNNLDERLVPDASSYNIGPFLTIDYESDNIGLNLGVRYDYKNLKSSDSMFNIDYNSVFSSNSFSSGIYYKVMDHIFRITCSGAFRAPHFSELFSNGVHHGTNRYEIGDQQLKIEQANQLDFKYQWSNDHFGFVINPFIQEISNFISINPTDSFFNQYRIYHYMQYNKVEIKGFEMNFHYHPHALHNLHFEQSYSFLNTKNKDDIHGLALTPANSIKTKILYDLSNHKQLVKYKFNFLSIYHVYKFEQNSFAEYEELTESYNVVNIQLGLKLNDHFDATLGVNNLFNKEYSPHISRVRGVAGGVPNPGRSFNINFKYEF